MVDQIGPRVHYGFVVQFKLTPHRILDSRLVPKRGGESVSMEGAAFLRHFHINPRLAYEQRILPLLVPGSFIGLLRNAEGNPERFVVKNRPNSSSIKWLIKKNPTFPLRLIEVWRVDDTVRETEFVEQPGPKEASHVV